MTKALQMLKLQTRSRLFLRLQATHPDGKGYEEERHASLSLPAATVGVSRISDGQPSTDPELSIAELGLTDELLGVGEFGHVLKVQ